MIKSQGNDVKRDEAETLGEKRLWDRPRLEVKPVGETQGPGGIQFDGVNGLEGTGS